MEINRFSKLQIGITLTIFNIGVLILTDNHIYPKYFETLFAFYFLIGSIVGVKFIISGLRTIKDHNKQNG